MRDASGGAPPRGGRPATIGIVAGEASGDALAATLIAAVRARLPDVRFVGVAGPKMEEAGCEAWWPLEILAVRGFVEVAEHLPELVRVRRSLVRRLLEAPIDTFVGVDAPDFNLGLERKLKRRGVRTVHFVSPSVWAWRRERIHTIGRSVNRMLALFPFEPPLYEPARVPVTYVGHPLAQDAADVRFATRGARAVAHPARAAGVRAPAGQPPLRARDARRAPAADRRARSTRRSRMRGSSCRWRRARRASASKRRRSASSSKSCR